MSRHISFLFFNTFFFICIYICAICLYMCAFPRLSVCIHVLCVCHVGVNQFMWGIFLCCSTLFMFVCHLGFRSWLRNHWSSCCLHLPCSFLRGCWDQNCGPQVCTACALLTELSPQPHGACFGTLSYVNLCLSWARS